MVSARNAGCACLSSLPSLFRVYKRNLSPHRCAYVGARCAFASVLRVLDDAAIIHASFVSVQAVVLVQAVDRLLPVDTTTLTVQQCVAEVLYLFLDALTVP